MLEQLLLFCFQLVLKGYKYVFILMATQGIVVGTIVCFGCAVPQGLQQTAV